MEDIMPVFTFILHLLALIMGLLGIVAFGFLLNDIVDSKGQTSEEGKKYASGMGTFLVGCFLLELASSIIY
jgi:hypothetical protein